MERCREYLAEDPASRRGIWRENGGKLLLERSLNDLQSSVAKFQVAFEGEMPDGIVPEGIRLLHDEKMGRVHTLIIEGDAELARAELAKLRPVILDVLPLTLEEIFIYEIGGADYDFEESILV